MKRVGVTSLFFLVIGCAVAEAATGARVNAHLEAMRQRAAAGELTGLDRAALHGGIWAGALLSPLAPEGYRVLLHAVYGRGRPLALPARYFRRSAFLAAQVEALGEGVHGPLWVRLEEDRRLALCFNPYFLTITAERVRISHPDMRFAAPDESPIYTVVPVGSARIRVPDNLVGALNATPYAAHAEWERE